MNASPFLVAATINYHLENAAEFQKGIPAKLKESMYVDNCVASVNTIGELNSFIKKVYPLEVTTVDSLPSPERDVADGPCLDQDQIPVVQRVRSSRYGRLFQQTKRLD
ncbi:hypothetical protein TNIN_313651 [Trichonephila inaurata madagascariensis]|uniref:Uncharacterized protein n=1 Tax=Trichonephila inaurata madagascariensis TaxID=2747483 RepID=A0A8X6XVV5_9ARAC|nr:hypothetical protein TNIN_313651 [Trichonephila inaurata madagascariensis]